MYTEKQKNIAVNLTNDELLACCRESRILRSLCKDRPDKTAYKDIQEIQNDLTAARKYKRTVDYQKRKKGKWQ